MTSPPDLPLVHPGLVWDGVTEYANTLPAGFSNLWHVRLGGDGHRLISEEFSTSDSPMFRMRLRQRDGWETIGFASESPQHKLGWFLNYDGTLSETPVNQLPYLDPYQEHASTYAHELDAAMGHHTLLGAEESDRLVVKNTISAMLGSAWIRHEEFAAIDPLELIVGGNNDGELLWKVRLPEFTAVDLAICGQCTVRTFARQFYKKADLPAFRRLWRTGIIYAVDRSTTPWSPTLFDVAPPGDPDWYGTLDAGYERAWDHYDTVVGAAERG